MFGKNLIIIELFSQKYPILANLLMRKKQVEFCTNALDP